MKPHPMTRSAALWYANGDERLLDPQEDGSVIVWRPGAKRPEPRQPAAEPAAEPAARKPAARKRASTKSKAAPAATFKSEADGSE